MTRGKAKTFRSQIHAIMCMLGIIPYLLVVYIFVREQMDISEIVLFVTPIILIFHLSGSYILRTFSDRLSRLADEISAVSESGEHSQLEFNDNSVFEIRNISSHFNNLVSEREEDKKNFNDMTTTLTKQASDASSHYQSIISASEERESHLAPYIGANIIEQLIRNNTLEKGQLNSRREVSVLFADIRAFTTISETSEPEDVVLMLNEYFELVVEVIHRHHGILDKFIGDGLMAVFGMIPSPNEMNIDAVNAAIEMQTSLQQLLQKRHREEKACFSVGIGINSGVVIVGDIGSRERRDYTVIGDSVNVASRLVQIADGGEILISRQTYNNCHEAFETEEKGKIKVKNRSEEVEFFKVICGKS